jgi:hypothetical protein
MARERRAAVFGPAGLETERDIDPEINEVESRFWDTVSLEGTGTVSRLGCACQ